LNTCPIATEKKIDFTTIIGKNSYSLLQLSHHLKQEQKITLLNRPFFAFVNYEASKLEDFLDCYGARTNSTWHNYRNQVAALRCFSLATYNILHLKYFLPCYQTSYSYCNFQKETDKILIELQTINKLFLTQILKTAIQNNIKSEYDQKFNFNFSEQIPTTVMPKDLKLNHKKSAEQRITHLATSILNIGAQHDFLHNSRKLNTHELFAMIPETINEESLRLVEYQFHNLRSLYDTYISESMIEKENPDLLILRGHLCIIFHLTEAATLFAHHFERYISPFAITKTIPNSKTKEMMPSLIHYCLGYCSDCLMHTREICQKLLKQYSKTATIQVQIPRYRGFHVRPSSLIAKIVHHYGTEISMFLNNQKYDAGSALDLFRANEQINAQKRRVISEEIAKLNIKTNSNDPDVLVEKLREIVLRLAGKHKLIIYQHPLPFDKNNLQKGESFAEFTTGEIARLIAMAKIDVAADINVTFTGDTRVLDDIKILAKHHYCEDQFGNNTPIPPELNYLKRK